MATNDEKFIKRGVVLTLGYRDSDGDFMHAFKGSPELYVNEAGDMAIIKGNFKFTHRTGFIDKPKRRGGG